MKRRAALPLPALLLLSGCAGVQSALWPQGPEAAEIFRLSLVLFAGAAVLMAMVVVLTAIALAGPPGLRRGLAHPRVIVAGGIVLPAVVLFALLVWGLLMMRPDPADAPGGEAAVRITVVGERWWWRVIYEGPDGLRFHDANEIRIPAGQKVRLDLKSADVIHSFWAPRLGGKLDMIPGRINTLTLIAGEPGISRGQCAEYCGGAHALMAFDVVVMEPEAFGRWLREAAGPAAPPATARLRRGQALFLQSGCGSCHTIRGTPADGRMGPDLTRVGARVSLAAGVLPNERAAFARWIVNNQHIKPGNRMLPFRIYSEEELETLSGYLESLG